jgi:hypothetical protein
MLDLVQVALKSNGFYYQRIDGQTSLDDRSRAISQFNQDPKCTVMIASIGSAGEGLVHRFHSLLHYNVIANRVPIIVLICQLLITYI